MCESFDFLEEKNNRDLMIISDSVSQKVDTRWKSHWSMV